MVTTAGDRLKNSMAEMTPMVRGGSSSPIARDKLI